MPNHFLKDDASPTGPLGLDLQGSAVSDSPGDTKERRGEARHIFSATAEVYEPKSRVLVHGRCSDLSLGGCYVDTINPLPIGTAATIRLQRESKSFTSPARVVYSTVGMGMGLAFDTVSADQNAVLDDWLRELSGEIPASAENENGEHAFTSMRKSKTGGSERAVLVALITALTQKGVLSDEEGSDLVSSFFS
jgi:hypothetical protein